MEKAILYLSEPGENTQELPRHVPVHVSHNSQGGGAEAQTSGWALWAETHLLPLAKGDQTLSVLRK